MYNHARTLLVNLTGEDSIYTDLPGDELIPSTFTKLNLPRYITAIRSKLFGAMPDRFMLNYRSAQLLKIIQSTRLRDYVTALDNRITYDVGNTTLYDSTIYTPTVVPFNPNQTARLSVIGNSSIPDAHGQCGYVFQLYYLAEDLTIDYELAEDGDTFVTEAGDPIALESITSAYLTVKRLTPPVTQTKPVVNVVSGLSNVIDLPYSEYKVRLDTEQANIGWTIKGFLQPQASMLDLVTQLEAVTEQDKIKLFGVVKEEPFLTFYNCWQNHPNLNYRLAAFTLALIYRTEAIRRGEQ